jgi:methionyl-tRNA formyltransferase
MADRLARRTRRRFELIADARHLTFERLAAARPRYVFFPHWSHRIPASIHRHFECVIFHMTDLPFGRGGSPLQNLISRGICETKITALRCGDELDAGPVYLKRPLSLHGSAEEIFLRAAAVMEDMIAEMLRRAPLPRPQRGKPTVFRRRRPEEGDLSPARSLEQAYDMIRMLDADGYPRAFLDVGPLKFEFTRSARKSDCVLAEVRITLAGRGKNGRKQ